MHNDLTAAIALANYQTTLSQQKDFLREKFKDDCILGFNGGLFLITPEFIAGVRTIPASYVVDMNLNPILIEDKEKFIEQAIACYSSAVDHYGQSYSKFKSQRSINSLVGI